MEKMDFMRDRCFFEKSICHSPSNKTSSVKIGLQELFARMEQLPARIQTDRGGEFHNREVKQYLESKGIKLFSTFNGETKPAVVER